MAELLLAGQPVPTAFNLLGRSENAMTYSLGWGLARSHALLSAFLDAVDIGAPTAEVVVRLQQHDAAGGFSDIEISDGSSFHLIIEAKRGWWLPSRTQLELYGHRFAQSQTEHPALVALTQWGAESAARLAIAGMTLPYRCDVLGWPDVVRLVAKARRSGDRATRLWLGDLETYLREVADMRDINSNRAYVVSLGHQRPAGWPYDFMEVVTQLGRYFFPASGKNWPKEPPNYLAFRYGGRLQSIHHVDDYVIATEMSEVLPVPPTLWDAHYVMTLGPAIVPSHHVPTGPRIRRAARVWVDIDLLLTSTTVSEALTLTNQRRRT